MSNTHKLSINNVEVKTTVIATAPELDRCLKELLSTIMSKSNLKRVVALEIYKSFQLGFHSHISNTVGEQVAIVKLCHGKICLIIQLHRMSSPPCSLSGFLQLQELSFVGVGIRHSLEALERDYGIKCRNAVDLGGLASAVKKTEILRHYALLDLAAYLCHRNVDKMIMMIMSSNDAALSDWGAVTLSGQQIEAATCSSFLCFYVGNYLFDGLSPSDF